MTGYINSQNLVSKVETRVEQRGGRGPAGRIRVLELPEHERRAGADAHRSEAGRHGDVRRGRSRPRRRIPRTSRRCSRRHRHRPALPRRRAGGPPPAPAAAPVEKLGEGVFKIGGNYASLAVDMGDHILVVESGQSDARGLAVMAAAKQAIPNKPIRFVVNSHPHFDHASGLAAAVAEGATILTHKNNEEVLERLMAGPRTLTGDSLSKVPARRVNFVEAVGDRDVRKGTNGKVVELHRVPNEHSDGMLVVYLPAEKVLWSADITAVNPNPGQLATIRAVNETLTKLKLDYSSWIQAHPPNPDKPLTKADVVAAVGTK